MSSPRLPLAFCSEAFWMRATARFALAGWMLPAVFSVFAATQSAPVQAQTPVQTVVVLDFAVSSGIDPLVGRKAADGLAVELQRSGDFEVVPRQRVEEAVAQQAGLQPPFNDTAQIRLGQAVSARSIFSGRVVGVSINPGKSARVNLEARQLDAATGDYINGTQVIETTEQKLGDVANEVLVDEAVNKAVFSAVRSMRQTALPTGTVLNTTRDDIELSIGARNGVGVGQRYSVLRDVFNRAKNVTERVKIAEVTITRVENDQATAKVSAGGAAGVRTSDRIRQIFVPGFYPVSTSTASGGSVTPVTAPPTTKVGGGGGGFIGKSGKGVLGLLGLAALVGLAGLGGGSSSSTPTVSTPNNNGEIPYFTTSDPGFRLANIQTPSVTFNFTAGFSGIGFSRQLQREAVVGFIIYRGTSPEFTAQPSAIQSFVRGTEISSANETVTFTDPVNVDAFLLRRTVTITATDEATNLSALSGVNITETVATLGTVPQDRVDVTGDQVIISFTPKPITPGIQYYYRVARITAQRVTSASTTDDAANTETNILPLASGTSNASDTLVPLFLPVIVPSSSGYSTDNLVVDITTDLDNFSFNENLFLPPNANVGTGVRSFIVDVSRNANFDRALTVSSPLIGNPNISALRGQTLQLQVGRIRVPSPITDPYRPGATPIYIRVRSIGGSFTNPQQRISNFVLVNAAAGTNNIQTSRFITTKTGVAGSGVTIGSRRGGGTGASGGAAVTARVGRPR